MSYFNDNNLKVVKSIKNKSKNIEPKEQKVFENIVSFLLNNSVLLSNFNDFYILFKYFREEKNYSNFKYNFTKQNNVTFDTDLKSYISSNLDIISEYQYIRIWYKNIKKNNHEIKYQTKETLIKNKLKDIKGTKKIQNKNYLPIKLVFFDIETLTHHENKLLYPLSNFWFEIDLQDFNVFDYDNKKEEYLQRCRFTANPNYILTGEDNPLNPMINQLLTWSDSYRVILIGYNSSGFDMFFVLDAIKSQLKENLEMKKNCNLFIAKNRIYKLTYKNIISFDLYLHLRMSLMDACIAFKTNPQKKKDLGEKVLEELQSSYENNMLITSYNKVKHLLLEYNQDDVMCLCSLLKKYNDLINSLEPFKGYKVWEYVSLPSMINNYFQKFVYPEYIKNGNDIKNGKKIVKPHNRVDYLTFKSWQSAGIVCIFGENSYSKNVDDVFLFDIVSQYPYVCINRDFPAGEYMHHWYFNKEGVQINKEPDLYNKLGIYWCEINTYGLYIPIVGRKKDNNTNNWTSEKNELYERALTTPEILYLRDEEKCDVKIIHGFTFNGKDNPFIDFMEPIAEEKIRLDILKIELEKKGKKLSDGDSILRTLRKLILNATTGAVNQRLYETETKIKEDGYLDIKNIKKNKDKKEESTYSYFLEDRYQHKVNTSRPYLGNFIYAYARILICKVANTIEKINKKYCSDINIQYIPCVIYGDTDSLVITRRGVEIWNNCNEINWMLENDIKEKIGKFGFFKCEGNFQHSIFIDKKIYCLYNKKCDKECNCKEDDKILNRGNCLNINYNPCRIECICTKKEKEQNNGKCITKYGCYPECLCSLLVIKKGECNNKNKYRLKGVGLGIDIDKKNGYRTIPVKKINYMLNEDIKKYLDKKCEENTISYIKNVLGYSFINPDHKEKIFNSYELQYYIEMRKLEPVFFDLNNQITNMRNLELYNYLKNGYQLKIIREKMLNRKISKNYAIKQITKELYISPNTTQYISLKLNRLCKIKKYNNGDSV